MSSSTDSAPEGVELNRNTEITLAKKEQLELTDAKLKISELKLSLAAKIGSIIIATAVFMLILAVTILSSTRDSITIESFAISPSLNQSNISGEIIAQRIIDELTLIQNETESSFMPMTQEISPTPSITFDLQGASLSLSQIEKYIRKLLGKYTNISGYVYLNDKLTGLSLRLGDVPLFGNVIKSNNIDQLARAAAEQILAATQPFRFSDYMISKNREAEALQILKKIKYQNNDNISIQLFVATSNLLQSQGRLEDAVKIAKDGVARYPNNPFLLTTLARRSYFAGNQEELINSSKQAAVAWKNFNFKGMNPEGRMAAQYWSEEMFYRQSANFIAAAESGDLQAKNEPTEYEKLDAQWEVVINYVKARDYESAREYAKELKSAMIDDKKTQPIYFEGPSEVNMYYSILNEKWENALFFAKHADKIHRCEEPEKELQRKIIHQPWIALSLAHIGKINESELVINDTPSTCYLCVLVRAKIAALKNDHLNAVKLFNKAIKLAPTLPFAYSELGEYYTKLGFFNDAIKYQLKAIKLAPNWSDTYTLISKTYHYLTSNDYKKNKNTIPHEYFLKTANEIAMNRELSLQDKEKILPMNISTIPGDESKINPHYLVKYETLEKIQIKCPGP